MHKDTNSNNDYFNILETSMLHQDTDWHFEVSNENKKFKQIKISFLITWYISRYIIYWRANFFSYYFYNIKNKKKKRQEVSKNKSCQWTHMTGTCCVLWRVKMLTFVDYNQDEHRYHRHWKLIQIVNCETWNNELYNNWIAVLPGIYFITVLC